MDVRYGINAYEQPTIGVSLNNKEREEYILKTREKEEYMKKMAAQTMGHPSFMGNPGYIGNKEFYS